MKANLTHRSLLLTAPGTGDMGPGFVGILEAQSLWGADVQCDVARGAEELVCVLVLRGSCEKKERRRRDGIVEIIFVVLPNTTSHHSVPGSVRKRLQRRCLKFKTSSGSQVTSAYLT